MSLLVHQGAVLVRRGSYCRPRNPRGTSWTQEKFRRATVSTTNGRCAICGSTDGVVAHHAVSVADGGADSEQGVQARSRRVVRP